MAIFRHLFSDIFLKNPDYSLTQPSLAHPNSSPKNTLIVRWEEHIGAESYCLGPAPTGNVCAPRSYIKLPIECKKV